MTTSTHPGATRATLIDLGNCIGCRSCQVACKQWNEREGEHTSFEFGLGLQNPPALSASTFSLVTFHEHFDGEADGGDYTFAMRRCFHCLDPACVSACPTTAMHKMAEGPVVNDPSRCIGCRYCIWACPWGVPTAEWDALTPRILKCTHCADRVGQPAAESRNGAALSGEAGELHEKAIAIPACVKACPANALVSGTRDEMLAEARRRIGRRPGRYVEQVYGEHEVGGTGVLYISKVPFARLGFPDVGTEPRSRLSSIALKIVPHAVMALGALLGLGTAFMKRREDLRQAAPERRRAVAHEHHPAFERLPAKLLTPFNLVLLAFMAFGVLSIVARFVLGLGASTGLSETWPWGLWILFDLVWIAVAAGAFVTAGLIYLGRRKDLYPIGRAAVFLGLLSYTFVTVTLLADLGRPLHAYQLLLQAPEHSAMFEVSWCIGMYVTILLFEFVPVVFEHRRMPAATRLWRRWSGVWAALAVSAFVYMLSRNLLYTAGAAAVFAALAWSFRARGEKFEPVILAIAAVTLSTMHQSSLGSIFLLMPGHMAPGWWSPLLPLSFFLSSIAAGSALLVVIGFAIAKGWKRPSIARLSAPLGQVAFWSLLAFLALRIGDLAARGRLAECVDGSLGGLFALEIAGGALLPMALLARRSMRARPAVLFTGCLLALLGVILNRTSVVFFAQQGRGPMPGFAPDSYSPSVFEWGITLGLLAATAFLFGLGARKLPILPQPAEDA